MLFLSSSPFLTERCARARIVQSKVAAGVTPCARVRPRGAKIVRVYVKVAQKPCQQSSRVREATAHDVRTESISFKVFLSWSASPPARRKLLVSVQQAGQFAVQLVLHRSTPPAATRRRMTARPPAARRRHPWLRSRRDFLCARPTKIAETLR